MQVPFDHTDCHTQYTGEAVVKVYPGSKATYWQPAEPPELDVIDVSLHEAITWVGDYGYELQHNDEVGFRKLEEMLRQSLRTDNTFRAKCFEQADEEYVGAREAYHQAKLDESRGK